MYTIEYYSAIKMNEIFPFCISWMEQKDVMLSKISLTEKEKYHMTSLVRGI